jgi:hypothetical protein
MCSAIPVYLCNLIYGLSDIQSSNKGDRWVTHTKCTHSGKKMEDTTCKWSFVPLHLPGQRSSSNTRRPLQNNAIANCVERRICYIILPTFTLAYPLDLTLSTLLGMVTPTSYCTIRLLAVHCPIWCYLHFQCNVTLLQECRHQVRKPAARQSMVAPLKEETLTCCWAFDWIAL